MKELKNTMNYGITLRKTIHAWLNPRRKERGKGVGKKIIKEVMAKSSKILGRIWIFMFTKLLNPLKFQLKNSFPRPIMIKPAKTKNRLFLKQQNKEESSHKGKLYKAETFRPGESVMIYSHY